MPCSWHTWSTMQGHESVNFGGQKVRRSEAKVNELHEAEDRFGGVADVSFSTTPFGHVVFTV